jgi:hypothetical protein
MWNTNLHLKIVGNKILVPKEKKLEMKEQYITDRRIDLASQDKGTRK